MTRWMRLAGMAGVAAMVACVATNSFAQEGRGRGGRGGFGMGRGFGGQEAISLVGNEAVQKELGLSEDQVKKADELVESYREKVREATRGLGFGRPGEGERPSPEEMAKRMEARREAMAKVSEEFTPKLKEVVSEDNLKRLNEISLQTRGLQGLTDEEKKTLNITEEQTTKLVEVNRDFNEKVREAFSDGPEGGREKMRELNKERDEATMAVLTQEQKDKFTEMKGKEFDLAQLRGQGGRGGPGGGGRRGNRDGA